MYHWILTALVRRLSPLAISAVLIMPGGAAQAQDISIEALDTDAPIQLVDDDWIPRSPAELEALVGRIALYPDDLISIVLPAATYPLQIVQAARFLEDYERDSSLQPRDEWDDSVVALLNYPEVLQMMSEDLDWTWELGEAVLDQQPDVLGAIQDFRARAYAAGNLQNDERQRVNDDDGVIEIVPAEPEVIYVPYYEPARVVVRQPAPVIYYYPYAYPVYYYPYPVGYVFPRRHFWGVTTAFSIGWHTRFVHVYHHHVIGHPFYGFTYHRPLFVRHPTTVVNINVWQGTTIWRPSARRGGARPRTDLAARPGFRDVRSRPSSDASRRETTVRERRAPDRREIESRLRERPSSATRRDLPERRETRADAGQSRFSGTDRAAPSSRADARRSAEDERNRPDTDSRGSARSDRSGAARSDRSGDARSDRPGGAGSDRPGGPEAGQRPSGADAARVRPGNEARSAPRSERPQGQQRPSTPGAGARPDSNRASTAPRDGASSPSAAGAPGSRVTPDRDATNRATSSGRSATPTPSRSATPTAPSRSTAPSRPTAPSTAVAPGRSAAAPTRSSPTSRSAAPARPATNAPAASPSRPAATPSRATSSRPATTSPPATAGAGRSAGSPRAATPSRSTSPATRSSPAPRSSQAAPASRGSARSAPRR